MVHQTKLTHNILVNMVIDELGEEIRNKWNIKEIKKY